MSEYTLSLIFRKPGKDPEPAIVISAETLDDFRKITNPFGEKILLNQALRLIQILLEAP